MEYQAQLREQIEEKRRKKEKEKQLEDDEKRRELEEYMASQRRGGKPNPQEAGKGQNRPPINDDVQEDGRFRHPNKGGKRGKMNPPSDDEDAVDDKYYQRNNRNNKRESTNGVGKGTFYTYIHTYIHAFPVVPYVKHLFYICTYTHIHAYIHTSYKYISHQ